MRTATIYNFLLEANLMASVAILLMIPIRKFLRKPLGNRLIYFLWLLIAIRLLCPLAIANPAINEFRPFYLSDQAIRPIAGQIKIRFEDAVDALRRGARADRSSLVYIGASQIVDGMYYGTLGRLLMRVYLAGAGAVALFFTIVNVRFRRKMNSARIEPISGKLQEQYLEVCKARRVKPIPVWFADPLPSACLVGVFRPYIALPLTAAPQEAVHVLTHEVCHYQGKDHWFNILRLLCCTIHWFNPLVWFAAFMSRTDGELACDSRVVRPLSQQDRLNYTNTLVLAASKRYAPGVGVLATGMTMTGRKLQNRVRSILNFERVVKWLMITVASLACVAFAAAFFTAERFSFPTMPALGAYTGSLEAQPLETEDDALRFAKSFLAQDALALDLADAEWSVYKTDSTYEIQAFLDPQRSPVTLSVFQNGTVKDFFIPSDYDRSSPVSNLYSGDAAKQEEVAAYIVGFWEATQPDIANAMEALYFGGESIISDQRYVSFYAMSALADENAAYQITVQVAPQVRMISFHTNSSLRYAQDTGMMPGSEVVPPTAAPTEALGEFRAIHETNSPAYTTPTDGAIDAETALTAALEAIMSRYQESNLERFTVIYAFVSAESLPDASFQTPYWVFALRNDQDSTDTYDAIVSATDGEVLYLIGQGEGNG